MTFLKFTAKFEQIQFVTVDKAVPTIPTATKPKAKTVSYQRGSLRLARS